MRVLRFQDATCYNLFPASACVTLRHRLPRAVEQRQLQRVHLLTILLYKPSYSLTFPGWPSS